MDFITCRLCFYAGKALGNYHRLCYNRHSFAWHIEPGTLPLEKAALTKKEGTMGRLIDAVLSVWRIRRLSRAGKKAQALLALEVVLAVVALFFPIIGQAALTVDILLLHVNLREKLAWIFFIWVMPFVGPLFYLLFGPHHPPAPVQAPASPAKPPVPPASSR